MVRYNYKKKLENKVLQKISTKKILKTKFWKSLYRGTSTPGRRLSASCILLDVRIHGFIAPLHIHEQLFGASWRENTVQGAGERFLSPYSASWKRRFRFPIRWPLTSVLVLSANCKNFVFKIFFVEGFCNTLFSSFLFVIISHHYFLSNCASIN